MYLSLTTDVAILLFLWGGYFLPACLFSLRITHVIKRCSAYPLTLWTYVYGDGVLRMWDAGNAGQRPREKVSSVSSSRVSVSSLGLYLYPFSLTLLLPCPLL